MNKIAFTTSRSPAKKTRSFIHDIISVVPSSQRVSRGSSNLSLVLSSLHNQGYITAIVVHSVKGNPNFLRIFDLRSKIQELSFAIKIRGVTLSREYRKNGVQRQPAFSILISSLENKEEEEIIKKVFGVTARKFNKTDSREFITVYADYIDKEEKLIFIEFLNNKDEQVGPRIKMKILPRRAEKI